MKILMPAVLVIICSSGCHKKRTENDAIREAVKQHLVSLRSLNLQAMDMDFTDIAIQGTQATAQVSFRLKTGAPAGAAMQVAYQLEKQNETWSVLKTAAMGGMIQHPAPGTNPQTRATPGDSHGNLPNFKELIPSASAGASSVLPPGHPAVPATSSQQQK